MVSDPTDEEILVELQRTSEELAASQEPLGPEERAVLHENLWDLYDGEEVRDGE